MLANEQVEGGKCWRCGNPVTKRNLKQWFFRITAYADEMLEATDDLDWTDMVKTMQKNWIGRSVGAEVDFVVSGQDAIITVFTTRPDTLFGASYVALAPEHPLVSQLVNTDTRAKVEAYVQAAQQKSDVERQENKDKTGVFTGSYVINPVNGQKLPIWVADYVLSSYGTGAVMAVPAHDERDFAFAEKFDLPIVQVVDKPEDSADVGCYTGEGELINSGQFDGTRSEDAREQIVAWLEHQGSGRGKTTYKMRDWLISRQRYWGDTLDGYACSSWYFLRYLDPHNDAQAWDPERIDHWMPVDYYNGADHAVAHLLYSRFWMRFFYKLGLVPTPEPFKRMMYNAYIMAPDGQKMSKSKGNVIDPMEIMDSGYGADALRVYEMFIAPYDMDAPWDPRGVPGMYRFLNRVWNVVQEFVAAPESTSEDDQELLRLTHSTIKKVTRDIEDEKFNTAVAAMMEMVNGLYKFKESHSMQASGTWRFTLESLLQILAPFAPHITEELWRELGHTDTIHVNHWPKWDEKYLKSDTMTIIVQVNGKLRSKLKLPVDTDRQGVEAVALADENVQKFTNNKPPKKMVYVPGKLVNIVV